MVFNEFKVKKLKTVIVNKTAMNDGHNNWVKMVVF